MKKSLQPVNRKIAYLGIDYHVATITVAVIIEGENDIDKTIRFANQDKMIKKYLKKISANYTVKACYEASCSGYVFQRKMQSWGFHCDVIAPSLIPEKRGDRRKNDYRDAIKLAKNYANGMLTVIHQPTQEEESVRSLIRCRLALKETEKRTKQKINAFILSQGCRWPKSKWTQQHRQWLSKLEMYNRHSQTVLEEYLGHLNYLGTRIRHIDQKIEKIAKSEKYWPDVKKLRAFRGIDILSAMILLSEICDFRRFRNPRTLMAFLGLIPSEDSSSDRQKGGPITKTGNRRCRTQLIESAKHCVKKPYISLKMKENLKDVDAQSSNIAIKCMHRLHKRYWALVMKGKNRNKALTAAAREFVGFIGAMMRPDEVHSG